MIDHGVILADSLSGAGRHSQAQTTPVIAAPPAGQVAAKDQPADVIIKKPSTSDAVETTQAIDGADHNSSGDKSSSNSSEVDKAPTDQTTPAKPVAEPKLGEDHAPLPPPPTDTPSPPPLPEKDDTVINKPTLTSEEASVSPAQPAESEPSKGEDDADKSGEPPAPPSKPEAPAAAAAAAKGDSSEPDAPKEESAPQSGANGESHAIDEGSAARKPEGATKPVLRLDRIRELSTATSMSSTSSAPGTPAEETVSSAVEGEEEGGGPESASTPNKAKRKARKKANKKKGEKNSPHPPSKETVNVVDNPAVQDRKPIATAPVDIPKGEGEGELVEKVDSGEDSAVIVDKVDSGEEEPAVIVEKPPAVIVDKVDSGEEEPAVIVEKPPGDAGKTADDTGSDEWPDWQ